MCSCICALCLVGPPGHSKVLFQAPVAGVTVQVAYTERVLFGWLSGSAGFQVAVGVKNELEPLKRLSKLVSRSLLDRGCFALPAEPAWATPGFSPCIRLNPDCYSNVVELSLPLDCVCSHCNMPERPCGRDTCSDAGCAVGPWQAGEDAAGLKPNHGQV